MSHVRSECQRAEAAQADGRGQIVVPGLLARVAVHRRGHDRDLWRDVDEQIGMRGVVHLVQQDVESADHILVARPQRVHGVVHGGAGGAVIGRNLERGGGQQQVGRRGADARGDRLAGASHVGGRRERAVGQIDVEAFRHAQQLCGLSGLLAPPPRVRGPIGEHERAAGRVMGRITGRAGAIGEEHDVHTRAGRRQLKDQSAASEHFIVIVRSDDEDASRVDALRL